MAEADQSADELFEHLQELVDRLPTMQEAQARLERAKTAEHVLDCECKHRECATMLELADEELAKAQAALEAALAGNAAPGNGGAAATLEGTATTLEGAPANPDPEQLDLLRRAVMYRSSQRGFRVGPEKAARVALEKALTDGGFADATEARAAALPSAEQDSLTQEIASYQQDYANTLARCQAFES